jgi:hypothetical protein
MSDMLLVFAKIKNDIASQTGKDNETLMSFDMVSNYTANNTGTKCMVMKTLSNEKMQATIMLAILDGSKLECVRTNFLMKDWLAMVWKMAQDAPDITGNVGFGSVKGHLTPEIKATISSINTDFVVIPVWMTSQLHVLDIVVTKSFKDH